MKKWLLCIPIAILAALFAPQFLFGWSSACGCFENDESFAYFVIGKSYKFKSESVTLGENINIKWPEEENRN